VARRGDDVEAEAFQIVKSVAQCMDFQFATVTGAGIHLADRQATAEPPPGSSIDSRA